MKLFNSVAILAAAASAEIAPECQDFQPKLTWCKTMLRKGFCKEYRKAGGAPTGKDWAPWKIRNLGNYCKHTCGLDGCGGDGELVYGKGSLGAAKADCELHGQHLPIPTNEAELRALQQKLAFSDVDATWLDIDSVEDIGDLSWTNFKNGIPTKEPKQGFVMVGHGAWNGEGDWDGKWTDHNIWDKKVGYMCVNEGELDEIPDVTVPYPAQPATAKPAPIEGETCLRFVTGSHAHSDGTIEFTSYDAFGYVIEDMSVVGTAGIFDIDEVSVCSSTPVDHVMVWNPTKDSWGGSIFYGEKSLSGGIVWIDGDKSAGEGDGLSGKSAYYCLSGNQCKFSVH